MEEAMVNYMTQVYFAMKLGGPKHVVPMTI